MRLWKSAESGTRELQQAILATRQAAEPPAGLSESTKAEILEAVHRSHSFDPLPSVFPSRARLLAAGAFPLALVLGLGFLVLSNGPVPVGPVPVTSARVSATKQDGDVRFQIHNGGRTHRVVRSTSPQSFDPTTAVTVNDGLYTDSSSGPGSGEAGALVFYRID